MPLCQRHIKWMTQAWAKRLCQSCGLPVSQVLMCTLSATRTDKIGNRAHFLQPQRLAQKLPPPAHPTFPKKNCFLFLGYARDMRISMTDVALAAGGNHLCATLGESDELVWCYAMRGQSNSLGLFLFFFICFCLTMRERERRTEIYSCAHGNSTMNNSFEIMPENKKIKLKKASKDRGDLRAL